MLMKRIKLFMILLLGLMANVLNAQTLINETFDSGIPADWTVVDNNSDSKTWVGYSGSGFTDNYSASIQSYATHDDYLITKQVVVSEGSRLTFAVKSYSSSYLEDMEVLVSTSTNATADFTIQLADYPNIPLAWSEYELVLTDNASINAGDNIYIAFRCYSNNDYYIYLDDVKVFTPVANDLLANNIGISPSPAFDGEEVTFTAYVVNNGSDAQTDVVVDFTIDGSSIGTQTIAAIASGVTENASITWAATQGTYNVGFSVPNDDFNDNNAYATTLSVYGADALVEDFEGAWVPAGWSLAPSTGGWGLGTFGAYEGSQCAYISTSGEKRMITPKLDLNNPESISFYAKTGYGSHALKLQYSTDKISWTDVPSGSFPLSSVYEPKNIDLSAVPAGEYYIAFVYNLTYSSVYIDNVVGPNVVVEAPLEALNPTPANEATGIAEDVSLQWTANIAGGMPAGYKVYFGTDGGGTIVPTNMENGTEQTEITYAPVSVLDFETTYYWQIVPTNAAGDAANCPIWSFTTKQDPTRPIPFVEDFETTAAFSIPADWSNMNYSVNETNGVEGSHNVSVNMWSGTSSASITTPLVGPLSAVANQVKFDYRICNFTGYPSVATSLSTDKIEVQLSTNGGVDFTTVYTINEATHVEAVEYATITLNLDAAYNSEIIKLRILNTYGSGDYIVDVDNVEIRETSATPIFKFSDDVVDFGNLPTNYDKVKIVTVTNDGGGTLEIADGGIMLSGADAADFSVQNLLYPIQLGAGENITFEMVCNAPAAGAKTASMNITHNAAKGTALVSLSANVYEPYVSYVQSFDEVPIDEIPNQWDKIETGMGMVYVVADGYYDYSHSSPNALIIANYSQASGNLMAILPAVEFSNSHLTFWAKADYINQVLSIGTLADPSDASTFTELENVNVDKVYAKYEVDFSTYSGSDIFIALKHNMGSTNNAFYIDDVKWQPVPTNPLCGVSPQTLHWDLASVGVSYNQSITISNLGVNTLSISESDLVFTGNQAAEFSISGMDFPIELAEGESIDVTIHFAPTEAGLREALLTINHNGENAPVEVVLSGNGFVGLVEDFNLAGVSFPPVGWTNSPAWKGQSFATYEGAGAAWFNPTTEASGEKLITPLLNYVSGDELSFFVKKSNDIATLTIQYTTDTASGVWIDVESFTVSDADYTEHNIDLSALPEGELFIGFSASSAAYASFYLDYVLAPELAPIYAVAYTVTDMNTGLPIEGANITINNSQIVTNSDGQVSLLLNNGVYNYTIEASGYNDITASVTVDGSDVSVQEEMVSVNMSLVTFNVADENEQPILDAAVSIDGQNLTTDNSGAVSVYLADDTYIYSVLAEGYAPVENASLVVAGEEITENIVLQNIYELSFQVTDENDNPIQGAFIVIGETFLTTDVNGDASINAVNGTYYYAVTKADYETIDGIVTLNGADAHEDVIIRLVYFVNFSVLDADGNPIDLVEIVISDSTIHTNASGAASIEMPNGSYNVSFSKIGYVAHNQQIVISDAHQAVEITLLDDVSSYLVTFYVTDGTVAIEGASIAINGEILTTDVLGSVSIDLIDGDYAFEVSKDGYELYSSIVTVAGADVSVNVAMLGLADISSMVSIYPNPASSILNQCCPIKI